MFTKYMKFGGIIWLLFIFNVKGQEDEERVAIKRKSCNDKEFCTERTKIYCSHDYYTKYCPQLCGVCDDRWVDPAHCRKMGCNQGCRWSLTGDAIHCVCMDEGYKLQADGKTCKDIDECLNNPCADGLYCNNKHGSYDCTKEKICYSPTTKYFDSDDQCCTITENSCGQNRKTGLRHDRVSPGQDPNLLDFPWTAMVVINGESCAGAILSDRWVLVSAHCFPGDSDVIEEIRVEVGSRAVNLRNWINGGTQEIDVDYWVIHPDFSFPYHDLALVRLSQPAQLSGWVSPVCLPNLQVSQVGDKCWLNGFESYVKHSKFMMKLAHINITVTDSQPCQKRMETYGIFDDQPFTHICGEFTGNSERSDCPGEIGGIMVCQRATSCDWYISGIASFGDTCSQMTSPSYVTFTSVFDHQSWISQITGIPVTKFKEREDEIPSVGGGAHREDKRWTTWSIWTPCSVTCGSGQQTRKRTCTSCINQQKETEEQICNTQKCFDWSTWSQWSTCTHTCGGGYSRRDRVCERGNVGILDSDCGDGSTFQHVKCNQQHCPKWSAYSSWSSCTHSCGAGGIRKKVRTCVNGITGDAGCRGSVSFTQSCNTNVACESWSLWSSWGDCSCSVTSPSRKRTRFCRRGRIGDEGCRGSWQEIGDCGQDACPVTWQPWGPWQPCSRSCDGGQQTSVRKCPQDGACEGSSEKMRSCNQSPCDLLMHDWSEWSPCSTTCSEGVKERKRKCDGPICPKSSLTLQRARCSLGPCDPQWSEWTSWSECPAPCGKKALVARMRSCPESGKCVGHGVDMKPCDGGRCPIDSCEHLTNTESTNFCLNQIPNCSLEKKIRNLCSKTCCYSQRITEQGICEDHEEWKPSCNHFLQLCGRFPNLKLNCKKTCGFC